MESGIIEPRILLIPKGKHPKEESDVIAGNGYNIHELETALPETYIVLSLKDYTESLNNGDFNVDFFWVTYINFLK